MVIPQGITREDVLDALTDLDSGMAHPFGKPSGYELVYDGRRYPPKAAVGLATKAVLGRALDPHEFSGGEAPGAANVVLRNLGFEIVKIKSDGEAERKTVLNDMLQEVLALQPEWTAANEPPMQRRGIIIRDEIPAAIEEYLAGLGDDEPGRFQVEGRDGTGLKTRVPWVRVYDPIVSPSATVGWYVVYLFDADGSSVYLSLNQGTTVYHKGGFLARPAAEIEQRVTWARGLTADGLPVAATEEILLADPGPLGKGYERGHVVGIRYKSGSIPDDATLLVDLGDLLKLLDKLLMAESLGIEDAGESEPDLVVPLADVVESFSQAVRESNLDYGTRHEDLIRAFTVSLATKRFALLTGLSGSGKTRLAMALGQWLGDGYYQIDAVRPDWTGPDALLGYEDGLSELKETGRAWQVPRTLEFMLRAAHDPEHAYLLVLDEMNLAHVERYFADVLSGMESDEPILPNLGQDDAGEWRVIDTEEDRIPFPPNLFVVGTVNIDETTYMFSPKVLDRANTLEFRVGTDDLNIHAEQPDRVEAGTDALVAGFLSAAATQPEAWDGADSLAEHLRSLHRILSDDDREFGHRVFFEAQRFGALLAEAGEGEALKALDLQVMQKILPRFHGSLRQLAGPLATLGEWTYSLETTGDGFDPLDETIDVGEAKLPISFDKIRRMTRRLRANHFVSFAE